MHKTPPLIRVSTPCTLPVGNLVRLVLCSLLTLAGCGGSADSNVNRSVVESDGSVAFEGQVWADNWFSLSLGGTQLVEDSVPITTERSFNAESFSFRADYPLHLGFVVKDFKENDTGLEYIGSRRQQMGDGGFIAQITDLGTGRVVARTNTNWRCLVIHTAPLDKRCADENEPRAGEGPCGFSSMPEPAGWREPGFDDSTWPRATAYSAREIGAKHGYDAIKWDSDAQLIWGPDLEQDNTLLCRATVVEPS